MAPYCPVLPCRRSAVVVLRRRTCALRLPRCVGRFVLSSQQTEEEQRPEPSRTRQEPTQRSNRSCLACRCIAEQFPFKDLATACPSSGVWFFLFFFFFCLLSFSCLRLPSLSISARLRRILFAHSPLARSTVARPASYRAADRPRLERLPLQHSGFLPCRSQQTSSTTTTRDDTRLAALRLCDPLFSVLCPLSFAPPAQQLRIVPHPVSSPSRLPWDLSSVWTSPPLVLLRILFALPFLFPFSFSTFPRTSIPSSISSSSPSTKQRPLRGFAQPSDYATSPRH